MCEHTWTKTHEMMTAMKGLPPLVVIVAGFRKIPGQIYHIFL